MTWSWPEGFTLTLWRCDYAITERKKSTLWSGVLLADFNGSALVFTHTHGAVVMYMPSLRYAVWTQHQYTDIGQLPRQLRRSVPLTSSEPQERVWEPVPWLANIIERQLNAKEIGE